MSSTIRRREHGRALMRAIDPRRLPTGRPGRAFGNVT
jgi:hypothetical protein